MNRFKKPEKKFNNPNLKLLLGSLLLLAIFFVGVSCISESNSRAMKSSLEQTLLRDVVHCYSTEGRYPATLEYIEDNYGLIYDHDRYSISYEYKGTSRLPEFSVELK